MRDRELNDRELKIKKETEELFFKPIIVSIDDMDKFEEKEMKKIRPIKNTWYDWLINYILELIRKRAGGFKNKVIMLFKKNIPKQIVNGRGKKLNKSEEDNYYEPKRVNNLWNNNYIEYESIGDKNKKSDNKEFMSHDSCK